MTEESLVEQLTRLAGLLAEVDARLSRSPVAPQGLEHLKQIVDNLRTSMWAVLSAGSGVTAPTRVEKLKLRRSIDGLSAIRDSLLIRPGRPLLPEYAELAAVAKDLAIVIDARD